MKKSIFLILLPIAVFAMMSSTPPGIVWRTYETSYYSIQYPPDWKIDSSQTYGKQLVLIPPKFAGEGKLDEEITVHAYNVSKGTEYYDSSGVEVVKQIRLSENKYLLDTFVRMYTSMLRDTMRLPSDIIVHHIDESVRRSINGIEYQSITASHENNLRKWKSKLLIFVKDSMGYDVGFMTSQERYNELIQTSDKILDSFHIK